MSRTRCHTVGVLMRLANVDEDRSPSGNLRAGIFEGNRGSVHGSVHELKPAVSLTNRIAN